MFTVQASGMGSPIFTEINLVYLKTLSKQEFSDDYTDIHVYYNGTAHLQPSVCLPRWWIGVHRDSRFFL